MSAKTSDSGRSQHVPITLGQASTRREVVCFLSKANGVLQVKHPHADEHQCVVCSFGSGKETSQMVAAADRLVEGRSKG